MRIILSWNAKALLTYDGESQPYVVFHIGQEYIPNYSQAICKDHPVIQWDVVERNQLTWRP